MGEAIFLNPQPSYKELERHYPKEKYYSLKRIDINSNKFKIKKMLYQAYFNPSKNNFLKKILFSPLKFIIRGTKIIPNKKLLDIGCGSGQFLYEMKELGLRVYGIEPGDFDKEGSKKYNLNIKNTDLLKARYPKEFFDIITMNHVLEHIDNPNQIMNKTNHLLKKDGTLVVGIPNTNSLAYRIFGKNWHQLDVPRHLFDYSNKNIKVLLEKNGFKIIKIRYNSRPNQFVVSLYFALGVKKRKSIFNRILEGIFLPLTWLVNSLKIGDQIEIWCEKR